MVELFQRSLDVPRHAQVDESPRVVPIKRDADVFFSHPIIMFSKKKSILNPGTRPVFEIDLRARNVESYPRSHYRVNSEQPQITDFQQYIIFKKYPRQRP